MEAFSALLAFCGESIGHRRIPLTKASDAELWCFLWSSPEQTVIWDAIVHIMTSLLCDTLQVLQPDKHNHIIVKSVSNMLFLTIISFVI